MADLKAVAEKISHICEVVEGVNLTHLQYRCFKCTNCEPKVTSPGTPSVLDQPARTLAAKLSIATTVADEETQQPDTDEDTAMSIKKPRLQP